MLIAATTIISVMFIDSVFASPSEIEIQISTTGIEIGDTFQITEYLDQSENIQGAKASINFTTNIGITDGWVGSSPIWDSTFFTLGTINNNTGDGTGTVNYTQNGISSTSSDGSLAVFNATALTVGVCYVNYTYMEISPAAGGKWYLSDLTVSNATFTVYPVEPAGLTATMTSDTEVSLSGFSSGNGGDYTVVRRATGSYPANPQAGTEVYNSTSSSISDTGLTANTTYFYRAWTWNDSENIFSDDNQSDSVKTNAHPDQKTPSPANDADNQDLNPQLSIYAFDYDDATQDMNVSFYTNESGSWVLIGYNASSSNGTYRQTPTNFDEWGTRYYWSVNITDSINWDNETYFFDTDPDDAATATNPYPADDATGVDLTPNCHVDIADDEGSTTITVTWQENTSGWTTRQVNTSVSDTDTVYWTYSQADTMNTDYWWRVYVDDGTNNESYGPWKFTTFNLEISNEYPADDTGEVNREPANISAYCAGSGMDVYIYFYNMTPVTDVWTLLSTSNDQSSGRFEFSSFHGNDFKWGNTNYIWSVNITDGNGNWQNSSYNYTTEALAGGNDARKDMENDDDVDIFDCIAVYNNYNDGDPYDGLFDVEDDSDVDIFDCIAVYNEYN